KQPQYPDHQYMSNFRIVLWFMATTSLNNVSPNDSTRLLNERVRFNTELTSYLTRGGSLMIVGQDWSDQQENAPFGQHVLHIRNFSRDLFHDTHPTSLSVSGLSDNPVGSGVTPEEILFDTSFENWTDALLVDGSGLAKPAFRSQTNPERVVGVTVESCSYRAVFLSFALERLSTQGMFKIISNTFSWFTAAQPEVLSIQSVEPSFQPDTSQPLTVQIDVTGLNFSVGNHVSLDSINLPVTSITGCHQLQVVVPGGLPDGLYDVTLRTAEGQVVSLPNIFKVGMGDLPTYIDEWQIH
ncbi:MAG: hypothetical protein ABIH23_25105, partial [bacterium]